jgi:DNA primase
MMANWIEFAAIKRMVPLAAVLEHYRIHEASRQSTVIVVEGFFDCLKVYQAGFGSVVALMGSGLYEPQGRLLMQRFRQIVLMLDGDAPGRRAAAVVSARLSADCAVRIVQLAENIQPDQLSEPVLRELLAKEGGQAEIH